MQSYYIFICSNTYKQYTSIYDTYIYYKFRSTHSTFPQNFLWNEWFIHIILSVVAIAGSFVVSIALCHLQAKKFILSYYRSKGMPGCSHSLSISRYDFFHYSVNSLHIPTTIIHALLLEFDMWRVEFHICIRIPFDWMQEQKSCKKNKKLMKRKE